MREQSKGSDGPFNSAMAEALAKLQLK